GLYDSEEIIAIGLNSAKLRFAGTVGCAGVLDVTFDRSKRSLLKITVAIRIQTGEAEAIGKSLPLDRLYMSFRKNRLDVLVEQVKSLVPDRLLGIVSGNDLCLDDRRSLCGL